MAYHTGLTLSQTAYTVLHLLPENLASLHKGAPNALMGIVFRAGLIGIVKCLGLVWEELSRGNLYDVSRYRSLKEYDGPIIDLLLQGRGLQRRSLRSEFVRPRQRQGGRGAPARGTRVA